MAVGELVDSEIYSLAAWIENHQHLSSFYPYDSIFKIVGDALEDSITDEEEILLLKTFLKILLI